MKKKILILVAMIFAFVSSFAQSRSSYDASFFKTEDQQAAIEVGKGFNIADPFTPTRNCFTGASRDYNLIKRQQQGSKTTVNVFYTRDDYEYTKFNSNHYSANVSFANIFNISGSLLNEMTKVSNERTERLIFIATIDFGNYFYQDDPVFTPEAQQLIDENKFDLFKTRYGSHFVSGYGKSSSIKVVLTKNVSVDELKSNIESGIGADFNYNSQSYGVSSSNKVATGEKFTKSGFSVDIELEGPEISTSNLKYVIEHLNNSSDLISEVSSYLINALEDLKDESKAWISRYFFTDFTLYGCQDIKWNVAKERKLSSINENYLDVVRLSNMADLHIENNSLDVIIDGYEKNGNAKDVFSTIFMAALIDQENTSSTLDKYMGMSDAYKSDWQKLKAEAQNLIPKLKEQYANCSDLKCDNNGSCCASIDYSVEVKKLFDRYNTLNEKVNDIFRDMINDFKDSNERYKEESKVKFIIHNISSHPYTISYTINGMRTYLSNSTVYGGDSMEIEVETGGHYEIEAKQKSGYTFYPTIDKVTVDAESGHSYTMTIGYDNN